MCTDVNRLNGQFLPLDLTGAKFGLLTVIDFSHKKDGNYYWNCLCECGKQTTAKATRLRQGYKKSCGHLQGNKGVAKTHGMRYTKIYKIWRSMKIRCTKENSPNYYLYGGRGISFDEKWVTFDGFYEDMKEGYNDGLSLERNDVDGNYCKSNCSWVELKEQAKNKRNTAYITYKGIKRRAHDWAELIGANPKTLSRRVYLGYSPEECLFGKQYEQIKKFILAESLI